MGDTGAVSSYIATPMNGESPTALQGYDFHCHVFSHVAGPNDTSLERSEPNDASVRVEPPESVSAVTSRGRSTWKGKGKGGYQDGLLGWNCHELPL